MNSKAVVVILFAFAPLIATAQGGKLGAYTGTFEVTGTEKDPAITFKYTIKVNLPVTKRDADLIEADFNAGEAPPATIKVTQYDYFKKEKSADSSGHFMETRCSLAAPVEVPASVIGIVDVDLRKKNYTMSLVVMSMKDADFKCTATRGAPYKKKMGVGTALGTGAPGMQFDSPQKYSDPARLTAKFSMDAAKQGGANLGPIVQEWDLKLSQ